MQCIWEKKRETMCLVYQENTGRPLLKIVSWLHFICVFFFFFLSQEGMESYSLMSQYKKKPINKTQIISASSSNPVQTIKILLPPQAAHK